MSTITFDTLKLFDKLKTADIHLEQTEGSSSAHYS